MNTVHFFDVYMNFTKIYTNPPYGGDKNSKTEAMEDHFTSRNTTPSAIFIHRCELFKENPPGKDWDGVWTMRTK